MVTANISRALFLATCVGLVVGTQSAQAGTSMPPGAFLHQPAPDITALNRQIQRDPLVAERYARLYNMSPEMVRSAFSKMHLSTLAEDHIYEIHYVHPGERIGYKIRRVRKGTAVYRMPDGTPALVRVCGNPIRATQPKAVRGAFRRAPELGQPETALDFQPYEPLEASMTPSPVPAEGLREGEFSSEFIESPGVPGVTEIPATPIGVGPVAAAASAVHAVSGFANAVPVLGALGALGGLGALAAGSGGSGSPGTIVTQAPSPGTGGGTPIIVVPPVTGGAGPAAPSTPEPGSVLLGFALLSAGGANMLRRRRKANRA